MGAGFDSDGLPGFDNLSSHDLRWLTPSLRGCAASFSFGRSAGVMRPMEGEEKLSEQGKKTAAALHQEMAREIDDLLGRVFAQRRRNRRADLEAVETALRTALHYAGAAALSGESIADAKSAAGSSFRSRTGRSIFSFRSNGNSRLAVLLITHLL